MAHCGLNHFVEEQPPASGSVTVEAENEFIQIRLEIFPVNPSLVSAIIPTLQQGNGLVNPWQQSIIVPVNLFPKKRFSQWSMPISLFYDGGIALVPVGYDCGTLGNCLDNEALDIACLPAFDIFETDLAGPPAPLFRRNYYEFLIVFPPKEGLVNPPPPR